MIFCILKSESCSVMSDSLQPYGLSVQLSHSVVSNSLRPHELQHTRPPCPSPTPGVHPDSHPSSQWCHPAISSSVVPFSSCPQFLPASESFPMTMDYTVHEILQARILEWVAFPFSKGIPNPGIKPGLPHCRQIFYQLRHKGLIYHYIPRI